MVAFAGYPLVVEDRLVGVMAMFAREELSEDTLEALGSEPTSSPRASSASRPRKRSVSSTNNSNGG